MTIHTPRELLENQVVTHYQSGMSKRALARMFNISRNTIRRILCDWQLRRDQGNAEAVPGKKFKAPRKSKLDAFEKDLNQLLTRTPDLSAVRVHEELTAGGFTGSLSLVRAHLRKIRKKPKVEPVRRFEVAPGQQGQMDWSFYTINFQKDGPTKVCCFGYVLKYSRKLFIDFCLQRDHYSMIRKHRAAFEYFGGAPRECLYDGEKTVLLRWEAGRPVYNPAFVAFLTHYGCRPVGCKPGRPQTKGGIETMFKYVEGNLLAGRTFFDLDDLRATTQTWLREKSDQRRHPISKKPIATCFQEEEAGQLLPLPAVGYDTCEVVMRVGSREGFVQLDTNAYSIPYTSVGEILIVKAGEKTVEIYDPEVHLIARHLRSPKMAAEKIVEPEHHRDLKKRACRKAIRERILDLGPAAEAYFCGLRHRYPKRFMSYAGEILSLKSKYHSHDLNAAMAHANTYDAYDITALHYILRTKAQPRELTSHVVEKAEAHLSQAIPEIRQRGLADYDVILKSPKGGKP